MAGSGMPKIYVNPTQVYDHDHLPNPLYETFFIYTYEDLMILNHSNHYLVLDKRWVDRPCDSGTEPLQVGGARTAAARWPVVVSQFGMLESSEYLLGQGCQMAQFDPFLSLDCARVEGVGAQSKERKGSNFEA